MIDEIDHQIRKWMTTVIDSSYTISFEHPGCHVNPPVISVYLYQLRNTLPTTAAREQPFQINLSYLITVQSENPLQSHQTLGELLFNAKDQNAFEVDFPEIPPLYWNSFGTSPLPYFVLRLPLLKPRTTKPIPIIKKPPHINVDTVEQVTGILLNTNNQPIPGAKVTQETTKAVSHTDKKGAFSMTIDSKNQQNFKCRVETKGQQYSLSVPMPKTLNAPITIHLETREV